MIKPDLLFSAHKHNIKLRNINERLATVKLSFKKWDTYLKGSVAQLSGGVHVMEGQRSEVSSPARGSSPQTAAAAGAPS